MLIIRHNLSIITSTVVVLYKKLTIPHLSSSSQLTSPTTINFCQVHILPDMRTTLVLLLTLALLVVASGTI
jgi:hypothetical protein